jgi:L-threonylcarbamoyladenylate synthase
MQLPQNIWTDKNLIKILQDNGVVIMPTDTIYGMVGNALNESVVNRIYTLRQRNPDKPCIVLIGEIEELEKFSIILSEEQKKIVENFSISTSFILDCPEERFAYLHRGTKTLAFRIPTNEDLRKLLFQTGPLVAPSANPEGLSPAKNIDEAKKYFGDYVDLYLDGGEIIGKASKIIKLHKDGTITIIRA